MHIDAYDAYAYCIYLKLCIVKKQLTNLKLETVFKLIHMNAEALRIRYTNLRLWRENNGERLCKYT